MTTKLKYVTTIGYFAALILAIGVVAKIRPVLVTIAGKKVKTIEEKESKQGEHDWLGGQFGL